MNEITNALRVVNTAIKTIRIIDVIKKATIFLAMIICCFFTFRFFRK